MINSIIEAISISLNKEFGDGYETHMEEMKQDLEKPCFFITCSNQTTNLFFGKRYIRTNQFRIQYIPETDEKQRECYSVAERMQQCLEYITICGEDQPMRGTKMTYEVVNGVLNFFLNYDCFIYKNDVESTTSIETIDTSVKVKKGD